MVADSVPKREPRTERPKRSDHVRSPSRADRGPHRSKPVAASSPPPSDPLLAARSARLRYVSDAAPGLRRRRAGNGFTYITPDGERLCDRNDLRRIRALAIPPAWTDVWICPSPLGHIQATGRDAKGRKQYRYHRRWRETRDETKFHRMVAFAEALPRVREQVAHDLSHPGLTRERVLAVVVRLLETTLVRVGNEEYARANHSYGLTTLKDRHVDVDETRLHLHFRGKSGKVHRVDVHDRRLARIVRRCRDLPGQDLFQFIDEQGERQTVSSADVNDYLRRVTGEDFTAKDFRTWAGTVLCAAALRRMEPPLSAADGSREVLRAIEQTAERLGNTPAVCRKSYVHPAVAEAFLAGTLHDSRHGAGSGDWTATVAGLSNDEASALALLKRTQHEHGHRGEAMSAVAG
jgi:DNA topoisomerase I